MRRAALFVPLSLALLAGGCATAGNPFNGDEATREIEIEVLNLNFNDATLYALRGGQRIRLGIATGKQSQTFTVDWPSSLPLQMEIRLIGGERCVTRELPTDPGDRVYLEIPIELSRNSMCVRR